MIHLVTVGGGCSDDWCDLNSTTETKFSRHLHLPQVRQTLCAPNLCAPSVLCIHCVHLCIQWVHLCIHCVHPVCALVVNPLSALVCTVSKLVSCAPSVCTGAQGVCTCVHGVCTCVHGLYAGNCCTDARCLLLPSLGSLQPQYTHYCNSPRLWSGGVLQQCGARSIHQAMGCPGYQQSITDRLSSVWRRLWQMKRSSC